MTAVAQAAAAATTVLPLTQASSAEDEEARRVAARLAGLGPLARAAVEEVLTCAEQSVTALGGDAELRAILHRAFVRSVDEFFTRPPVSSQLPRPLIPWSRPARTDSAIRLAPASDDRDVRLDDVLRARRSIRDYAKDPLPLDVLSTVLSRALGRVSTEDGYGTADLPLFPYPSTGGLSAFDVGIVAQRVDGLDSGYYQYDQVGHQLVPRIRGDLRLTMQDVTFESEWLMYAPVVLVFVHHAPRFEWKYTTRGYRFSHVDVGAALQSVCLSALASGLGTCALAAFFDEPINELLGYDGYHSYVSLLTGVGEPATPLLASPE